MPPSDLEDQADEMATAYNYLLSNLLQLQVTERRSGSAGRNGSKAWNTFLLR